MSDYEFGAETLDEIEFWKERTISLEKEVEFRHHQVVELTNENKRLEFELEDAQAEIYLLTQSMPL